jgi:hypothetical protein
VIEFARIDHTRECQFPGRVYVCAVFRRDGVEFSCEFKLEIGSDYEAFARSWVDAGGDQ